jgi:thiamine-phosphate pyrophosphorylase
VSWAPTALYAILDYDLLQSRRLSALDVADAWLGAGVRLIQLRAKRLESGPMLALADQLVSRASRAGASVIINDRADVAVLSGAAGVHVGQGDLTAEHARQIVGPDRLVGLSTHNVAQVTAACGAPVSYIAIGPVFPTTGKDHPDPVVGLEGVRQAASIAAGANLPVVAIGGITLERAVAVREAGAKTVAVISDLLVGSPGARATAWLSALA